MEATEPKAGEAVTAQKGNGEEMVLMQISIPMPQMVLGAGMAVMLEMEAMEVQVGMEG